MARQPTDAFTPASAGFYRAALGELGAVRTALQRRRSMLAPASLSDEPVWAALDQLADLDIVLGLAETMLIRLHNAAWPPVRPL